MKPLISSLPFSYGTAVNGVNGIGLDSFLEVETGFIQDKVREVVYSLA